jgi:uncharacterized phage protein (TIGR01671 family)
MKNRKFRGLRKHGNYWVYGSLIREGENCYIIPDEPVLDKDHSTDVLFFGDREVIPVTPETVGRFIGILDKNGKEIYEDDIVNWRYLNNLTVPKKVEYIQVGASDDMGLDMIGFQDFSGDEVIGNVHENPELLRDMDIYFK